MAVNYKSMLHGNGINDLFLVCYCISLVSIQFSRSEEDEDYKKTKSEHIKYIH